MALEWSWRKSRLLCQWFARRRGCFIAQLFHLHYGPFPPVGLVFLVLFCGIRVAVFDCSISLCCISRFDRRISHLLGLFSSRHGAGPETKNYFHPRVRPRDAFVLYGKKHLKKEPKPKWNLTAHRRKEKWTKQQ